MIHMLAMSQQIRVFAALLVSTLAIFAVLEIATSSHARRRFRDRPRRGGNL